jgi:hypothetical protein
MEDAPLAGLSGSYLAEPEYPLASAFERSAALHRNPVPPRTPIG